MLIVVSEINMVFLFKLWFLIVPDDVFSTETGLELAVIAGPVR